MKRQRNPRSNACTSYAPGLAVDANVTGWIQESVRTFTSAATEEQEVRIFTNAATAISDIDRLAGAGLENLNFWIQTDNLFSEPSSRFIVTVSQHNRSGFCLSYKR